MLRHRHCQYWQYQHSQYSRSFIFDIYFSHQVNTLSVLEAKWWRVVSALEPFHKINVIITIKWFVEYMEMSIYALLCENSCLRRIPPWILDSEWLVSCCEQIIYSEFTKVKRKLLALFLFISHTCINPGLIAISIIYPKHWSTMCTIKTYYNIILYYI